MEFRKTIPFIVINEPKENMAAKITEYQMQIVLYRNQQKKNGQLYQEEILSKEIPAVKRRDRIAKKNTEGIY